MHIVVPVKLVPDLVEEIVIRDNQREIDTDWISFILNEFDNHAIEQAILIKERQDAEVTVIAPDIANIEDVFFEAAAKGVDNLIKLCGDFPEILPNHTYALALEEIVRELNPQLVLTGVQAHEDLDGQLGGLLAELLAFPYLGYVSSVAVNNSAAVVKKEYPGGLLAEMEVDLPAVLGIQAADSPPRYVAFSKIREAMKSAQITEREVQLPEMLPEVELSRLFHPESGERAQILEGSLDEISTTFLDLLKEKGVL